MTDSSLARAAMPAGIDPHPAQMASWRDRYRVHPCADVYPLMSNQELVDLGEDIREREGLTQSIVLWHEPESGQVMLLDGRNRLEALERIGAQWLPDGSVKLPGGKVIRIESTKDFVQNPAAYVISCNIHRRHLSKEARAELILKTIEAGQIDIAKVARSFNPTEGKKGGSTTDPVFAQAVTEAQKHGISKRTVQNARAKLQGKRVTSPPRARTGSASRPTPVTPSSTPTPAEPESLAHDPVQVAEDRNALVLDGELSVTERDALRLIDAGYRVLAHETGGSADAMARLDAVRDRLKALVTWGPAAGDLSCAPTMATDPR